MKGHKMKTTFVTTAALALALTAHAEFKIDRSVMSDKYWAIWNDEVQAKIDADIEKYRKADATVEVAAPDGAEVKVEQVGHAFYFGAHIFNFNQLGKKEWNDRYKELYGTLFNSATVAFYWRTLEQYPYAPRFEERYEDTEEYWNREYERDPKAVAYKPHWRRPAPDPVISFLKTRRVRIHGHPLVWGNNAWHTPTWLWDDFCPENEKRALEAATGVQLPVRDIKQPICTKDMRNDPKERWWNGAWKEIYAKLSEEEIAALVPTFVKAQRDFYEKRVREIGERYGSRIDSWDVVNESASDWALGKGAKNDLPVTKSHYGLMPANYAYNALVLARKYMKPDAWLNVNEYNMDAFPGQIADLERNGASFDVVGSQMHLFNPAESRKLAAGEFTAETRQKVSPEGIATTMAKVAKASGGGTSDTPFRNHHHRAGQLAKGTDGAGDHHAQLLPRLVRGREDERHHVVERRRQLRRAGRAVDLRHLHARHAAQGRLLRDGRPHQPRMEDEDDRKGIWRQGRVSRLQGALPPFVEGRRGQRECQACRGRVKTSWTMASSERKRHVKGKV